MNSTTILTGEGISDHDVAVLSATIGMCQSAYMVYSYTLNAGQIFQAVTEVMASIRPAYDYVKCAFDDGMLYANGEDSQWNYKLIESVDYNFGAVILYFACLTGPSPEEMKHIAKLASIIRVYLKMDLALKDCAIEEINIPPKSQPFEDNGFSLSHSELAEAFRNSVIIEAPYQTTLTGKHINLPAWYRTSLTSEGSVPSTTQQSVSQPTTTDSGGCYVATAVYGSYDCPEVWTLRRFRDFQLEKSWHGRIFIKIYYAISPILVKHFGAEHWFQRSWKGKLDRLVTNLRANGFDDTPYCD